MDPRPCDVRLFEAAQELVRADDHLRELLRSNQPITRADRERKHNAEVAYTAAKIAAHVQDWTAAHGLAS